MAAPLTLIRATEARRLLAGAAAAVGGEEVPLGSAAGRVLTAPVLAPEDAPAFPRALMDGYAVRAADVAGAGEATPARLRLAGSVAMGEAPGRALAPGEAVAIGTGGHVPAGANAVVMVEHTAADAAGGVAIRRPVAAGQNLMPAGGDLAVGALAIPAGRRLGARELAVLAGFGIAAVPVHRRPRVAVLSTGAELCPAEERPAPGRVRDVNQPALAAAAARAGAEVTRAGIADDDPGVLAAALAPLVGTHDLVLISGGSSVGTRDFTGAGLAALGGRLLFHGIDVRPGKPTLAATLGRTLLVGLPGVPTAALVIFDVFVRPVLWRLGGEADREPWPARRSARLAHAHDSRRGREEYLRVRLEQRPDGLWAGPLAGGAAGLSGLLRADGLVIVPEEVEALAAGAPVEVCLWD
jgi:molybdopterin molybdotransferase